MFENTSVGIGVLKDRRIVQANRRLAAMFGYEPQDLIGLDGCSMCSLCAPDDAGAAEGARGFPGSDKCGSFADEVQFRRKDGTLFWGHCGLTWVGRSHGSNDVVWVVEDITERKRRERAGRAGEERLQRALDAARLVLWDYDLASGEVYLSEIWSELLGGPHVPTTTTVDALTALVPEEDRPAIVAAIIPVIKGERQNYQIEHRVQKPGGEIMWVLSEGRVVERGADGRALRAVGTNRDVTERKCMEHALRASEVELRLITRNVPAIISYLDSNLRYRFINQRFSETFGLRTQDVYGKHPREIFGDAAYDPIEGHFAKALNGSSVTFERSQTLPGGEVGHFEIRLIPHLAENKFVDGCYALALDVTGGKRAEETRAWLAAIVENSTDAIIGRSLDDKILSWNAAAERMFGYSAAEAIGQPITITLPPDHHFKVRKNSGLLLDGGFVAPFEHVRITKDGRLIDVMSSVSPIKNEAGEIAGAAVIVRDISESKQGEAARRESEERFHAAFEQAGVGMGLRTIDPHKPRWLRVNQKLCDILGYTRDELLQLTIIDITLPGERDAAIDYNQRLLRGELKNHSREKRYVRKDGEIIWVNLTLSIISDANGRPAHTISVVEDITERKRAQEQVITLNAELEQRVIERTLQLEATNKELESFSYSVSHDLRAPLRRMSGFGAIVLKANEGKLDAVSVDHLKRITAAGERMGTLIDDLLALSRISRQELNKRDFDLSELADKVADALVQAHPGREVRLTVEPEMKANGDPGLVRVVLENLLGNAWKFTARTSEPWIEVGLEQRAGETVYNVRDNGAGFDAKYAHKLFEPFQRLHSDSEFKGTGIGLSIVRRIVARHGGRIWAEAKVGEGAAFYFTLS